MVTNTLVVIALENRKLKGLTWCLLYHPAVGYKRLNGQDPLVSREYRTVQSREIRAKKMPDRRDPEQSKVK
jgi:hypothetical protein